MRDLGASEACWTASIAVSAIARPDFMSMTPGPYSRSPPTRQGILLIVPKAWTVSMCASTRMPPVPSPHCPSQWSPAVSWGKRRTVAPRWRIDSPTKFPNASTAALSVVGDSSSTIFLRRSSWSWRRASKWEIGRGRIIGSGTCRRADIHRRVHMVGVTEVQRLEDHGFVRLCEPLRLRAREGDAPARLIGCPEGLPHQPVRPSHRCRRVSVLQVQILTLGFGHVTQLQPRHNLAEHGIGTQVCSLTGGIDPIL